MRKLFSDGVDELDEVGVPMILGVSLDAYTGAANLMVVPPGMCFIVQKVVGQGIVWAVPFDPSPVVLSPGTLGGADGVAFVDAAGTTQWSMSFRPFVRDMTVFGSFSPITWKSSEPLSLVNWTFKHPLCVPAGWTMQNQQAGTVGGNFAAYGRLVSESEARQLGYTPSNSATDANRMCGVDSMMTFSTSQIVVPARAGYSIQILDIHMRLQPTAAVLTNSTMTVEQGDGRAIFVVSNNNPGDLREWVFSPGIYLKPDQSLNCKSSTALTGSVVVSWRYVPTADVPSDHWWACVEPGLPTPAAEGVGATELQKAYSHEVTCFYPRLNTTKTSPTTSFQHILRGYLFSIQKDALAATAETETSDIMLARISNGAAGGVIGLSVTSITDTGIPMTPLFGGFGHDQNVTAVVDDVNLPGKQDNGSFWIDTLAMSTLVVLTTPITTLGIDEFWVTLWGKTIPSRFTNPSNKGAA